MKLWTRSPLFRKFLISYLLVLFIPLITGFVTYGVSVNTIKSSSVEASTMLLNQTKDILDRRIEEVESFARQLAMNPDLNYLLSEVPENGDYSVYALWRAWRNTAAFGLTNNFLQDFYVYLKNSGVILTASSVFVRPDDYYDLSHFRDMGKKEWREEILDKVHQREILPSRPFVKNGRSTSVIAYMQSLPLDSLQHSLGTVVILIDESEMAKMLERVSKQYGGWSYISDRNGNVIARVGIDETHIRSLNRSGLTDVSQDPVYKGRNLLVSLESEKTGWVYVVGLPEQTVFRKAVFIERVTWTITGLTLLFGMLAATLMAYRSSRPIGRLVAFFGGDLRANGIRGKTEYDFLQGNISRMIAKNQSLEAERKKQLPLLKDSFLKRLLRGDFGSPGEQKAMRLMLSEEGISGEFGHAAIIRINGYSGLMDEGILDELNSARLVARKILQEVCPYEIHTTDLDADKMAVLFVCGNEAEAGLCGRLKDILVRLREEAAGYKIRLTAAIGNAFDRLSDVSRSFDEARQMLEYGSLERQGGIVCYRDRDAAWESDLYYYPIDWELRLMNAVKAGEPDEAKRILAQLFEQNFRARRLLPEMIRQLFLELKGTLLKILQQTRFPDAAFSEELRQRVVQLPLSDGADPFRLGVENLIARLCSRVEQQKQDDGGELAARIKAFLETAYTEPDLNLYRISEAAGVPGRYLSQLFKEHTGEHISEYLEKIRMKKAAELLLDSNCTIDEISRRVGYNSAHAFRRAFKRVCGVSPSSYRQAGH